MPFQIVEGDITKQRVGAIVNAANTRLVALNIGSKKI